MKWLFLFLTLTQWYLFCFLIECFNWWGLATAAIIALTGMASAACTCALFTPTSLHRPWDTTKENGGEA